MQPRTHRRSAAELSLGTRFLLPCVPVLGSWCWGPSGVLLGGCEPHPETFLLQPAGATRPSPSGQSWRLGSSVLRQGVPHVRVVEKERGPRIPRLS